MDRAYNLRKVAATLIAAAFACGVTTFAVLAESQFTGTWNAKDTQGNPFQITLSADGSAQGQRGTQKLSGKWKEEVDSVMIDWGNKWTTQISKAGDKYKKTAFENGKPMGETDAQKVK